MRGLRLAQSLSRPSQAADEDENGNRQKNAQRENCERVKQSFAVRDDLIASASSIGCILTADFSDRLGIEPRVILGAAGLRRRGRRGRRRRRRKLW